MTAEPDRTDAIVRSLVVTGQRRLLDEIGRRTGTPVVYLKSAWADPVLYGGVGERSGIDLDVLIRGDCFEPFAAALEDRGFRRYRFASPERERYFTHKEVTFLAPPGAVPVDLHRELCNPGWYDLPAAGCLARAIAYDSAEGPILSLSPEDQVLYAAVHYANHLFALDDRHLEDVARLIARQPVDWAAVLDRARAAGLRLCLRLVLECLRARGVGVSPDLVPLVGAMRLRRRLIGRWVSTGPTPAVVGRSRALDYLVLRPLLADRYRALPGLLTRFGAPWIRERLAGR